MTRTPIAGALRDLVDIKTGEVHRYFVSEPIPLSWRPGRPEVRAWRESELTKSGQPDRRTHGACVGVERHSSGYVTGHLAELDHEREDRADVARAALAAARAVVKAAEEALVNVYL